MASDGVTDARAGARQGAHQGRLLLSLESTSTRMLRLGRSELSVGRHVPPSELIERIEAVTKDEVEAQARAFRAAIAWR